MPSICSSSTARTYAGSRSRQRKHAAGRNYCSTRPSPIVLNEHFDGDGAIIYEHACKLGCEGIVSKRLGSAYKSWPLAALGEGEEPGGAGSHARSRGGLVVRPADLVVMVRCLHCPIETR